MRNFNISTKRITVVALMVMVGLSAAVIMYLITAQGPGVSADSTVYIETARNLLSGKGFFVDGQPMTHYPPAYPFLLAVVGFFTSNNILLASRLLSALFFGVNIVLVGLAVYISTTRNMIAFGCAVLISLLSAPVILIHSMAWSEAPYIAFSMAGLILISRHVVHPNIRHLVLASLLVSIASVTRYVGITLLSTIALALFILSNKSFHQRIKDTALFLGIAILPIMSWLIRNMLIAHSATDRVIAFHPFNLNQVKSLITQMYKFILPISISGWTIAIQILIASILFVMAMILLSKKAGFKESILSINISLPIIFIIYSVLYIAFLFFSISFIDAHIPVNQRLLLPVFFVLIVVSISVAKAFSEAVSQRWVWYGFVLFGFFAVSINADPAISEALDIYQIGRGYTARVWRESEILASISHIPETTTIYSNGIDVIRFYYEIKVNGIPHKLSPNSLIENNSYKEDMNQMISNCEEGNAVIVYFNGINRWYVPSKQEIESSFNSPLAVVMEDGVIYGRSALQIEFEQ